MHEVYKAISKEYAAVATLGLTYQMHGLVLTDENLTPLRPAIIWCDSRAVAIGEKAFRELGEDTCFTRFLNSPGNFTASKLRWVKENEPSIYDQARHMMLPGDYIAARLTGEVTTTYTGLSEGILWNYMYNKLAHGLVTYFDLKDELFPEAGPSFGPQGAIGNDGEWGDDGSLSIQCVAGLASLDAGTCRLARAGVDSLGDRC